MVTVWVAGGGGNFHQLGRWPGMALSAAMFAFWENRVAGGGGGVDPVPPQVVRHQTGWDHWLICSVMVVITAEQAAWGCMRPQDLFYEGRTLVSSSGLLLVPS